MLAAADPAVERMRQDPMYGQVVNAMAAKGLQDDAMAANVYAAASRANLAGVTNIEIGNRIEGANGQPDRTLFVFDGRDGVEGPVHARLSENDARATPVQVAANIAETSREQQPAGPEQETRRTMAFLFCEIAASADAAKAAHCGVISPASDRYQFNHCHPEPKARDLLFGETLW
jgi:hypothetical protein